MSDRLFLSFFLLPFFLRNQNLSLKVVRDVSSSHKPLNLGEIMGFTFSIYLHKPPLESSFTIKKTADSSNERRGFDKERKMDLWINERIEVDTGWICGFLGDGDHTRGWLD